MSLTKAVDNLCVYDPEFKHIADGFLEEFGANGDVCEVKTMDELKTAVNSYRSVKFFEVVLHGTPGTVHMGEMTMAGWYLAVLAETNPNFLQKNAQILFNSCSIGKGETGDRFMDHLGARLLKGKGGIIGASTVDSVTSPMFRTGFFLKPLTFGRIKVKRYDIEGRLAGSLQVDRHGFQR